jgi:hypothetical protein
MERWDDATRTLLTDWFRRARESQHVHYVCANHFSRLNYYFGIPTIVLTTVVGTAVFASLDRPDIADFKILIGLVSVLAAVLSSLQTFLGFQERSAKHRTTSAGYGSVRRRLELLKTFPPDQRAQLEQIFVEIKKAMDDLAQSSPEVPARIGSSALSTLRREPHDRIFQLSVPHLTGSNKTTQS